MFEKETIRFDPTSYIGVEASTLANFTFHFNRLMEKSRNTWSQRDDAQYLRSQETIHGWLHGWLQGEYLNIAINVGPEELWDVREVFETILINEADRQHVFIPEEPQHWDLHNIYATLGYTAGMSAIAVCFTDRRLEPVLRRFLEDMQE